MEALDIISKRIDKLADVLGPIPDGDVKGGENLFDTLISANTLLTSAVSGRDKILDVVNRSGQLESYLDPAYLDEKQDIKSKEVYINTVATDLASSFEMLEKVKALEPTLGAEYFRNIPDVTDKLKDMKETASEQAQQNDLVEQSLILAMQRYSEIQNGLKESLRAMNERIDNLEERLKPKQKPDVDV